MQIFWALRERLEDQRNRDLKITYAFDSSLNIWQKKTETIRWHWGFRTSLVVVCANVANSENE